jgi:uncharacterized protein (DUF2267 family)
MTITSFDVFETTLHKTNRSLKELMEELDWQDQHAAYLAMRATLLALRDRLTVEEVAQLGAQLPMLIRGLYTRAGIRPASRSSCGTGGVSGPHRPGARRRWPCQFRVGRPGRLQNLAARVTSGEIEDVKDVLPAERRQLWP